MIIILKKKIFFMFHVEEIEKKKKKVFNFSQTTLCLCMKVCTEIHLMCHHLSLAMRVHTLLFILIYNINV